MFKARTCLLPFVLMLATAGAVPAHASELVKLGKLIVTGKRAPEGRPATPTPPREPAPAERAPARAEPERSSAVDAAGSLDSTLMEAAPRPVHPPTEPTKGEPVSRGPATPVHG